MQQSGGYTTLGELSDYVTQNVKRKAVVENNGKSQTPTVIAASSNNDWRNWRFADKAAMQIEDRIVASATPSQTQQQVHSSKWLHQHTQQFLSKVVLHQARLRCL